jgi:CheY-like chemotaxis protein
VAGPSDVTCGANVLIVDDDADGVDALRYLLESHGYRVDSAGNGRDALDYLREGRRPCVVILDLAMPVMNGWQFLAARERDEALASIPVIVVTASQPALAGAEMVMTKPVDLDTLLARIGAACARTDGREREH